MHIFKIHLTAAEYMKYVKSILRMFLINTIILFSFISCNDSPVEPEQLTPGRRDYTWSVDTLKTFIGNEINSMWGSSENDIWCGLNAGTLSQTLFHYNGKTWENKSISEFQPYCFFGFSSNNIWAGGFWGQFWHYDGVSWKKFSEHSLSEYPSVAITKIFGLNANDIYAGGVAFGEGDSKRFVLMHFNGVKWDFIDTPYWRASVMGLVQQPNGEKAVIINTVSDDSCKVMAYNGKEFIILYKGLYSSGSYSEVKLFGSTVFVGIGPKMYKYENGKLNLVLELPKDKYLSRLWGRSEKDIFCLSKDQSGNLDGIGHYNGSDLVNIYPNFPNPRDAFILPNLTVFFVKDANGNNIILKGTLK